MNETQRLLREYVDGRSEQAFREIVNRYIDLVYSVALRRVDGDAHRAEDVVQTVFSDLARKAPDLPPSVMLGGWLHRHCCFVAGTMLRTEMRRQARERVAMDFLQNDEGTSWRDLAPVVDEAIQDLEEPDREALTLRYFERRDLRSLGGLLGTSEDAAQKRVSRALEKLRHILAKRGIALSAAALGAMLDANAVSAAPAGLAAAVGSSAAAGAGAIAGVTAGLGGLLGSAIVKFGAVALLAVGIGGGLWLKKERGSAIAGTTSAPAASVTAGAPSLKAAQKPLTVDSSGAAAEAPINPAAGMLLTLLSAETGEPIANAAVEYRGWEGPKFGKGNFTTDAHGRVLVAFPRESVTSAEITTRVSPYADTRLQWKPPQGDRIPGEYTLRLTKGTPIGGFVQNERGEPVSGAKVGFNLYESPELSAEVESHNFAWIEAETDSAGRWRIDRIAEDVLRGIFGGARHPEYVPSPSVWVSRDAAAEKQLREQAYTFRLGNAVTIRGVVLDRQGNAVSGASVLAGTRGEVGSREMHAALDGSFELKGVRPGPNVVTAQAPQFAPKTINFLAATNTPPIEIVLGGGSILHLRLVNKKGEPIPNANVWLDTLSRSPEGKPNSIQADFSPKTDREGRVFWDQAPEGELKFAFAAPGYMRRDEVPIIADGTEHTIVLQNGLRVHGTVRDAENGQPIQAFRVVTGWPSVQFPGAGPTPQWSDLGRFTMKFGEGKFDHTFEEPAIMGTPEIKYVLKFQADGYASYISRVLDAGEEDVTLDVSLKPASALQIAVLDPNGQPAAGTEVVFANAMQRVTVGENGFSSDFGPPALRTDEKGVIPWSPDESVVMIYAANRAGFAQAAPAQVTEKPVLQLQPWGRIEGSYTKRGQPVKERTLALQARVAFNPASSSLDIQARPKTDEQGHFEFPQVPPITYQLCYLSPTGERSYTFVPLEEVRVEPGETTVVEHAENGTDVIARLRWPDGVTREKDDHLMAIIHTPAPQPPAELARDPAGLRQWRESPEIAALIKEIKSFPMHETPEGLLKAETVPAGTYALNVTVGRPGKPSEVVFARRTLSISPADENGTLDLGEIALEVQSIPAEARRPLN